MKNSQNLLFALFLIVFSACSKEMILPEPGNDPESLFEYFWESYDQDYAGFEERNVDWQAQYDTYRPRVNANTTEDSMFSIFKQMLLPLNDGHVKLIRPGHRIFTPNIYYEEKLEDELFDLEIIKSNYLKDDFLKNGYDYNTYGWLPGNIGYIHTVWTSDNWEDMGEILEYFANAKGLIMDLRHNGGGDFTQAFSRFGRLTEEDRLAFREQTKNGPGEGQFTDWTDWNLHAEGEFFDKPIVMLIDRYTISAGERLALAFKTLPNVTTVGDTTNGALSSMILRELPNGWNYSLSTQKVEFENGELYEGIGIPPDIISKNTPLEMQNGQDKCLEFALGLF